MRNFYRAEFIGDIEIKTLEPEGYSVSFYLNHTECPVTIMADLPDDEFLAFIKEEIRKRKLIKTKYYETRKLYYTDC